jgi:phosphinothricin acetyltransferase
MKRRIRLATPEDAAAIRDIYAPYVDATAITFATDSPTTDELAAQIEDERYPWLVCETSDGTAVGYAAASPLRSKAGFQWAVELSMYVTEPAQGKSVGTALATALLELLTEQGYCSGYSAVTIPNPPSVRLHERLGFEPVGTFPEVGYKQGAWHDVQWWERGLAERPSDPDPPRPLSTLQNAGLIEPALEAGRSVLKS